ncbi:MAG: Maf family protein [Gammaproteobacteria bacterium]
MSEFILASGSSRRHSLLNQLDLAYRISIPDINEMTEPNESPEIYVCRMARSKALQVFETTEYDQSILAADTIITLSNEIIGKPIDVQHAKNILQKLSAAEHNVLTALYLKTQNENYKAIVKTKVKFRPLSSIEINAYCLTDEPYDKAGAYAIQGLASSFIEYISGSYTNVMGLPLLELTELLRQAKLYDLNTV